MYEVEVQVRDTKITQASRTALRNAGRIPAVVYDKDGSAINVSIDGREAELLVRKRGASGLIALKIDNQGSIEETQAIFKNIQYDYKGNTILHLDFQKVHAERVVKIKVPVAHTGVPYGVLRQGGVLQQNAQETEIHCLPAEIPDCIKVDVSDLKLNEIVRAEDVEGFTYSIPTQAFFTVASSRAARKIAAQGDE